MIQHKGLHHVSIIVTDLERSKAFYQKILGLREIERPAFDFPGAWLEVGDSGQQLHLIIHEGETLRTGGIDTRDGHFAIRIANYEAAVAWLQQNEVEFRSKPDSITGFAQIFLLDPDRNIIELNAEMIK
ncbi:glyoxalase [Paenibacillus selenitireducens]|uniref:Glyoxalase n=1 Tax=Paenibacillus selenitireducens TaxID=1324314 RepID=A0A1T2X675_9BACL|nr:VOC family protein [Paenibacillus selenitireducens]OPA75391.1 glyoxalase [Paenibacillus selenitireducens]